MTHRVVITQEVLDALGAQAAYLTAQAAPTDRIDAWLAGLFDLIDSLSEWARRYPFAEALTAVKGYEVRRANHGDYAIFYRVDADRRLVEVIAFRHGARRSSPD